MKNSTPPNEISFNNMPQAVAKVYDEVFLIRNQLAELKQNFEPKTPTEYLTRTQVSEMLKCDLSSVHNWTVKGLLIPYGISNRVYYKRSEVEAALIPFGKNRGGASK